MIVVGKIALILPLAVTLFFLFVVVFTAREHQEGVRGRSRGIVPGLDDVTILDHRKAVDAFLIALAFTALSIVILVEYAAWATGIRTYGALFWVHETSDTIVVVSLVLMRTVWTGAKKPDRHRAMARFVLAPAIVITFVTGGMLLYRL